MTLAVGNGERPEPARSEPINQPAKKQHHTERNKRAESHASEGIFAPRWHINLPLGLTPAHRSLAKRKSPAIDVAGPFRRESGGWGAWGIPRLRIPTIVTTDSDTSRPPVPIDRDQCEGAVRCIF
jgi:hypothetical protein